jgi:uncharacterized protein (DUF1501 family)
VPTTVPAVAAKDGILVLLTLYGGNDGLNTLIPYQDGSYLGGRGPLAYQPNQVLPLDGELALHPSLKGLKALWDAKQLAAVRGVGYPNPNRSHFRSMDIWQSGVPDAGVATGWVGRWLDLGGARADPLRAVSVGGTLPRVFGGEQAAGAAVPVGQLSLPGGPAVAAGFSTLSGPTPGASPLAARVAQVGADLLTVDHAIADMLAAHPADDAATASSAGGLDTGGNGGGNGGGGNGGGGGDGGGAGAARRRGARAVTDITVSYVAPRRIGAVHSTAEDAENAEDINTNKSRRSC